MTDILHLKSLKVLEVKEGRVKIPRPEDAPPLPSWYNCSMPKPDYHQYHWHLDAAGYAYVTHGGRCIAKVERDGNGGWIWYTDQEQGTATSSTEGMLRVMEALKK